MLRLYDFKSACKNKKLCHGTLDTDTPRCLPVLYSLTACIENSIGQMQGHVARQKMTVNQKMLVKAC